MPDFPLDQIDVVVLCGGLGTRLRSSIGETQKVMATVGGKPFLDFWLEELTKQGFRRVILCTGYQAQTLEEHYAKKNTGLTLEFSREEIPLGTGGAIKQAQSFIRSNTFVVLNGDSFCPIDLPQFLNFHLAKQAVISLVASLADERSERSERQDVGRVLLDGMDQVVEFLEKVDVSQEAFINAGVYCMNKVIFTMFPGKAKFSLETDLFPRLTGRGFYGYVVDSPVWDIGTPERYKEAQKKFS
jgi:NDP-sugar pyrophosphorylase family protein